MQNVIRGDESYSRLRGSRTYLRLSPMNRAFKAVIKKNGRWWIGWIEELPGVNSQGRTREELLENLRSALQESLEINRAQAIAAAEGTYEEEAILV